ncbi:uncharacterized protein LOC144663192 [Oculina patagonica]
MGGHGEFCSRLFHLLLLSHWFWNPERGPNISLSDCSSSLGDKIFPGNQEWDDLSRNIFGLTPNSASFCLAVGITDKMPLFFPHWNATLLKVMTRIKRCHRPCLYYSNCSATFRCAMIYEIVFKLNPGPNGPLSCNPNNLIAVDQSGMSPSDNRPLKICSLNARSLRNKSAAFVELVNDLKADLFTICETPVVRERRPPYSPVHPVSIGTFFAEFSHYLESVVMSNEQLVLLGDFNIHVDVPTDMDAIQFRDLLDSMGLQQHVKRSTHIHGHTLDLLITRQSDEIIVKEPETERYFSDHAVVLSHLRTAVPALRARHAEFRKLKEINKQQFLEDIRNSSLCRDPPDTLDELVECYNNTLRSLLDKHAPVRARHVKSRTRPHWFNDEIMKARRERRSAERKWRASRSDSDLVVFKAKRNFALHVMNESRRAYYKQYIDENSFDQGRLFRASKRLLNFHVDKALPPHTDARMLANEMGEYFVHKITAIRSELDADASGATSLATSASPCSEFSEFTPLSEESVRRIAASCAKSCALDPLPSSILTFCLDELLPVLRKIVNLSLESGVFAEDWKNALVHPLLKKAGLKHINKNF